MMSLSPMVAVAVVVSALAAQGRPLGTLGNGALGPTQVVAELQSGGGVDLPRRTTSMARTEKISALAKVSEHSSGIDIFTRHAGEHCLGSMKNVMSNWNGTLVECKEMCKGLKFCSGFLRALNGDDAGTCDFLAGMITIEDPEEHDHGNVTADCYHMLNPYLAGETPKGDSNPKFSDFVHMKHRGCSGSSKALLTGHEGSVSDCQTLCRGLVGCAGFMRNHETNMCTILSGNLTKGESDSKSNCYQYLAPPASPEPVAEKVSCHMCLPTKALYGNTQNEHTFPAAPGFVRAIDIVPDKTVKVDIVSFYCVDGKDMTVQAALYSGETKKILTKAKLETIHCLENKWKDQHLDSEVTLEAGKTYFIAQLHTAGTHSQGRGAGDLGVKTKGVHYWLHATVLPAEVPAWMSMGFAHYYNAALPFVVKNRCGKTLAAKVPTAGASLAESKSHVVHCGNEGTL